MIDKDTTIKLKESVKKSLHDLKIHPRQTYEEIIKDIIKKTKEEEKRINE